MSAHDITNNVKEQDTCPRCRSTDVTYTGQQWSEGDSIAVFTECQECEHRFVQYFLLIFDGGDTCLPANIEGMNS